MVFLLFVVGIVRRLGWIMHHRLLPILFGLTLFVSAALLFLVQPLIARRLLPLLGGTPAVWSTCMLFFQAALLAGIPNDPSRFYPYSSETSSGMSGTAWKALRSRQRYVLDRMVATGAITQAQRDAAVREELHLLPPSRGLARWIMRRRSIQRSPRRFAICFTKHGLGNRFVCWASMRSRWRLKRGRPA